MTKSRKNIETNNASMNIKKESQTEGDNIHKHHHFTLFSNKILIVIFVVIEISIIALMYPSYRLSKNHTLARNFSEKGDFQNAKKHYLLLKGIYPQSETINLELGNVYFNLNDYSSALDCYNIVLEHQNTPSGFLLKNIGICYNKLGKTQEALNYFGKALESNSNDPEANFYYGEHLLNQKKYAEAAKYFERIPSPERFGDKLAGYWREIEKAILGDLAGPAEK